MTPKNLVLSMLALVGSSTLAQSSTFDPHTVLLPDSSWTIGYTLEEKPASYVFKLGKAFYDKNGLLMFGTHSDGSAITDEGNDEAYFEWREEDVAWYEPANDNAIEFLAFNQHVDSGEAGYCVVLEPSKAASTTEFTGYQVTTTADLDWLVQTSATMAAEAADGTIDPEAVSPTDGLPTCTITLNK